MPAVCRKRLHGGGDGDRSHRASQARARIGFLDASNWQPICRPCHARKTATETRRRFMTPEQAGWQEPLMETASRGIAL